MENYCRILTIIPYKKIKEIKRLGFIDGYKDERQINFITGTSDKYLIAFGQLYEASFKEGRKEKSEMKDFLDLL